MMKRITVVMMTVGVFVVLARLPAEARQGPAPIDLLDALTTGQIEATFYGNGDASVRGRIRRSAFGPGQVFISPGTQFWAQREDVQGMTTLGWVPVDLATSHIAYVTIPTACTNYKKPAPTPLDRMNPVCCPEPRMEALAEQVGRSHSPQAVAQIAVWAIANNPQWSEIAEFVEMKVEAETPEERTEKAETYLHRAADLMRAAGVNPRHYHMFR